MEDLTGGDADRLAIVVSAEENSKLLWIPKVISGESVGMAESVVECLYNWNLQKITFKLYILIQQQAIQMETKVIAKLLWCTWKIIA